MHEDKTNKAGLCVVMHMFLEAFVGWCRRLLPYEPSRSARSLPLVELLGFCQVSIFVITRALIYRTSSSPLLLRRALSSRPGNIQVLQPVFLLLVDDLVVRVETAQLADGAYPRRVVGCNCGPLEALVQDARSETEALGVVCGVEDFALDLTVSADRRRV